MFTKLKEHPLRSREEEQAEEFSSAALEGILKVIAVFLKSSPLGKEAM